MKVMVEVEFRELIDGNDRRWIASYNGCDFFHFPEAGMWLPCTSRASDMELSIVQKAWEQMLLRMVLE